jgi:Cu(I)/Ag(I) efflux system membrane fusion protein
MKSNFFILLFIVFVCYSCDRNNRQQQADQSKPEQVKVEQLKTIYPERKEVKLIIPVNGVITYDPSQFENISSRYMGRIEKLFVKYKNQSVTKGKKLFDIYCPDMMTGQSDLLYLLKNDPRNEDLIHQARQKLILLGLTEHQIEIIEKSGQPDYMLGIYSPVSGFTIDNENPSASPAKGQKPSETSPSSSMEGSVTPAMGASASITGSGPPLNELQVREGMYVRQGQTLFRIVRGDRLWGIFKINADMSPFISTGQSVEIAADAGVYKGKIDFVEPVIRIGDKTITIRVLVENHSGHFKVGQLVNARIFGNTARGIWIPRSAVIDLGNKNIVFLKTDDSVQPRQVLTGITYENSVLVYSGLNEKDQVIEEAQYLFDSDTFIKSGLKNLK